MSTIRELQPAHKSDKVTVAQAARAFKKVRSSSGAARTSSPSRTGGDKARQKNGER